MATTGRDVVSASLRLIGVMASGESASAQEATDGLNTLNRMISSWSTEKLLIYAQVREAFALTQSQATYTMGPGGNFDTTRPLLIEEASLRIETVSPAIELPIRILSEKEWVQLAIKDIDAIPEAIYEDHANPLTTINVYPRPNQACKLVLFSQKALTQITTLDTSVIFPEGYEEALIFNLAIRLAPEYGKAVTAEVSTVATDSKARIKRANHRARYLQVDPALRTQGRGFNWRTGGFG